MRSQTIQDKIIASLSSSHSSDVPDPELMNYAVKEIEKHYTISDEDNVIAKIALILSKNIFKNSERPREKWIEESKKLIGLTIKGDIAEFPNPLITPKKASSSNKGYKLVGERSGSSEDGYTTDYTPSPFTPHSERRRSLELTSPFTKKTPKRQRTTSLTNLDSPVFIFNSPPAYLDQNSPDGLRSPSSPSDRSRSSSSGYYPNDSGSRDSISFSASPFPRSRIIFSPGSRIFSPIKHLLAYAAKSPFDYGNFELVSRKLDESFATLEPHHKAAAIDEYINLAKTTFTQLNSTEAGKKPIDDTEKEKSCRIILESLFVAFPDISMFEEKHLDQQEIQAILIYCYQFLFFEKGYSFKNARTIFDVFSDQHSFEMLKPNVLNDLTLLPYLGYIYLQFLQVKREDEFKHYNLDFPRLVMAILQRDKECGEKETKLPWRTHLLNSYFNMNPDMALECLALCIKTGNQNYIKYLLDIANMDTYKLLDHFIATGKWRMVIQSLLVFKPDEILLQHCIECALAVHSQTTQPIKTDMTFDLFIALLLKEHPLDFFRFTDMLVKNNKWKELANWLPFSKNATEADGFVVVDTNLEMRKYFFRAILAEEKAVALEIKKRFNVETDLKDLCNIKTGIFTSKEWLDLFLHAINLQQMRAHNPTTALQKNSLNKHATKLGMAERIYCKMYLLLNGIKSSASFAVHTIVFLKDELHALRKGPYKFFYLKLQETQAAEEVVTYIRGGTKAEVVGVKRGIRPGSN